MKKGFLQSVLLVFSFFIIAFNFISIYNLHTEISHLSQNYLTVQDEIWNLRGALNKEIKEFEEAFSSQSSFFNNIEVRAGLSQEKISLNITAIPKDTSNNDDILAKLTVNGQVYESKLVDNEVEFLIDYADNVNILFVINSGENVKVEYLGDYEIGSLLESDISNSIEKTASSIILTTYLSNDCLIDLEEIDSASFYILEEPNPPINFAIDYSNILRNEVSSFTLEDDLDESKKVLAEEILILDGLQFQSDITDFISEHNKSYCVYLAIETKGGAEFISSSYFVHNSIDSEPVFTTLAASKLMPIIN